MQSFIKTTWMQSIITTTRMSFIGWNRKSQSNTNVKPLALYLSRLQTSSCVFKCPECFNNQDRAFNCPSAIAWYLTKHQNMCCRISFVNSFKGHAFTVVGERSSNSLYDHIRSCLAEAAAVNANERSSCWPLGTATHRDSFHCFLTSSYMTSGRLLTRELWNSHFNCNGDCNFDYPWQKHRSHKQPWCGCRFLEWKRPIKHAWNGTIVHAVYVNRFVDRVL